MSRREFAQAAQVLERAIETCAAVLECTIRLAPAYRALGRLPEALAVLERATALFPQDRAICELMLEIAEHAGDRRRAVAAGRALIKISPRHIRAHTVLSEMYMMEGDISAALRTVDTLVRLDP